MEERKYEKAVRMLQERLERMKSQLEHPQPLTEATIQKDELTDEEDILPQEESLSPVSKPHIYDIEPSIHVFSSKKESLKHSILQILLQGQQTTIQLKKRFVDLDKKCSKASFYRYVQELKKEQKITTVHIGSLEYCIRVEK
jgi:hypothetical protein